ncbi:hypothetical protein [Methanobrevibacter sp. UBA417]|uniref:hypothetical protein n=1 Tax=Methanobrevibacter sp. UBA417 TaxID=1915487 RepID=UPI0039B99EBB
MEDNIVKVRGRHGTKSLDITIPVKISEKYDIKPGDLFKVVAKKEKNGTKIVYSLIYKSNR